MADEKKETLSQLAVKGAGDDGKVVLWERHPDHPKPKTTSRTGEIFLSNDGTVRIVAETPQVKRLIGEGRLVMAKASEVKGKDKDEDKTTANSKKE